MSKLLGHAKVSTTSRYLAATDSDRHSAVRRLTLPVEPAPIFGNEATS